MTFPKINWSGFGSTRGAFRPWIRLDLSGGDSSINPEGVWGPWDPWPPVQIRLIRSER